ncbi:unnamed protein product [Vicia faba]|uniref:Uncharacterized protein n=1 Tax=Vicia faba TaxID=3906 RepID=A0AAV0YGF1_VICFA|nr:unnamed protein product [Vicia faba]
MYILQSRSFSFPSRTESRKKKNNSVSNREREGKEDLKSAAAKQHQSQSSTVDELRASSCESPSPNRHNTYPYDIPTTGQPPSTPPLLTAQSSAEIRTVGSTMVSSSSLSFDQFPIWVNTCYSLFCVLMFGKRKE